MRLTGVAFGRNSPKFDTDWMLTLFKVRERMAIPTHATIKLAPAAEGAAGETEPKVLLEITFRAMCQSFTHTGDISLSCMNKQKSAHAPDAGMWPVVSW
jgi:hypothetical protein